MSTFYNPRNRIDILVAYDSSFVYDGISAYDASYTGTQYNNRTQIPTLEFYLVDIDGDYILDINGNYIIVLGA